MVQYNRTSPKKHHIHGESFFHLRFTTFCSEETLQNSVVTSRLIGRTPSTTSLSGCNDSGLHPCS